MMSATMRRSVGSGKASSMSLHSSSTCNWLSTAYCLLNEHRVNVAASAVMNLLHQGIVEPLGESRKGNRIVSSKDTLVKVIFLWRRFHSVVTPQTLFQSCYIMFPSKS